MDRQTIAIVILALVCVFAGVMAGQPNDRANDQYADSQMEISLVGGSQNETNRTTNHPDRRPPPWYAPLERSDWWLVFVGIGATYAALATLHQMRHQAELLERSTIATELSVQAVQRAFIVYDRCELFQAKLRDEAGKESVFWHVSITWKNVGNTPAVHAFQHFQHGALPDEPDNDTFKSTPAGGKHTPIYVGPKGAVSSGPLFIPDDKMRNPPTPAGQSHYFWGWVAYKDIFSNSEMHLTEYCAKVTGVSVPDDNPQMIRVSMSLCARHNAADRDCDDYETIVKVVEGLEGHRSLASSN